MTVPLHARNLTRPTPAEIPEIPTARVNLLPAEIEWGRQVRTVRRRLLLALALVLALALAGSTWFRLEEGRAADALAADQTTRAELRAEQEIYAEVPRIKGTIADIDRSLAQYLVDDVTWQAYLDVLVDGAPEGVVLTAVEVEMVDRVDPSGQGGTGAAPGDLDTSGREHVGVLVLSGRAPHHDVAVAWVDLLTTVDGFEVPFLRASHTLEDGADPVEFTIEVTLSSEVRSLRYALAVGTES